MNCYELQDNISAYIEKELSLQLVNEFDNHVTKCTDCYEAYEGVLSVIDALKYSRKYSVSESFNAKLQARISEVSSRPTQRFKKILNNGQLLGFQPKYAFASVATFVAIVVITFSLVPEKQNQKFSQSATFTTANQLPGSTEKDNANPLKNEIDGSLVVKSDEDSITVPEGVKHQIPNFEGQIQLVKDRK